MPLNVFEAFNKNFTLRNNSLTTYYDGISKYFVDVLFVIFAAYYLPIRREGPIKKTNIKSKVLFYIKLLKVLNK